MPSDNDRIDAFLAGTLDEADTTVFLAQLDRDPALRDELAWGMLVEGLLAEAPAEKTVPHRPQRRIIALAAAAVLAVAASLWLTLGTDTGAPAGPRLTAGAGGTASDADGPGRRLGPGDTATLAWPSGRTVQLAGPGNSRWETTDGQHFLHSDGGRLATADSPTRLSVATPDGRLVADRNAAWSLQIFSQRQVVQVQRGTVRYTIDATATDIATGDYAVFARRSLQQSGTLLVEPGIWARWDCDHGDTPVGCQGPASPWPLQAIAVEERTSSPRPATTGLVLDSVRMMQSAPRRELAGILGGGEGATGGTIACWIRAGDWPQLPERLLLARIHADDPDPRQLNWALNRSILAVLARQPDRDHHLVLRVARDGGLTTYFNGERGTVGTLERGRPLPEHCRLSLGPGGTDQPAILLRQIAIWTLPLASSEIKELHRAGLDGWSLPNFGLH